jgi:hypothetical protein
VLYVFAVWRRKLRSQDWILQASNPHICLLRQSFMEWLNLEGIGDKKRRKKTSKQAILHKTLQ